MTFSTTAPRGLRSPLGMLFGVGLAVLAAACTGNSRGLTSPSGAAPSSLDAKGGGAGGADKRFSVTVSPASISTGSSVLTVTIKNESDGTNPAAGKLGSVQIVVPSGLAVTSVGNFSNAWGTTWASGQTVTVGATGPGAGTNKLAPGASMSFTIGVDATLCLKNDFTTLLGSSGTLGDTFTADWTRVGSGVSVTVTGCSTETECPAAQAVANAYLNSIGFEGSRGGINSAIAAHTTDGNHFDGMAPCDTGYAAAVIAFVHGLLAA